MAPTQLPTSEVLNTAADLIEERGWSFGPSSWGGSGGLCIEGGIIAALGADKLASIGNLSECPAHRAVIEHVGEDNVPDTAVDGKRLWAWNDTEGRTASEVIEVLRATAVIEQTREDAALLAEAGRA